MKAIQDVEQVAFWIMISAYYYLQKEKEGRPEQFQLVFKFLSEGTAVSMKGIPIKSLCDFKETIYIVQEALRDNAFKIELVVPDAFFRKLSVWAINADFVPFKEEFRNWFEAQSKLNAQYREALKDKFYKETSDKRLIFKAIALLVESVEILNELPWKYWKRKKGVDKIVLLEEMADLLHFIPELAFDAGIRRDELIASYYLKNVLNLLRQYGCSEESFDLRGKEPKIQKGGKNDAEKAKNEQE